MFKVTFVTRDYGSYAYEEEKHEFCFDLEKDAKAFYDDLENFIEERTGGDSYVVSKSKPEKLNDLVLYRYDPYAKKLCRID